MKPINQVKKLQNKIAVCYSKIKDIQDACEHPLDDVEKEWRADTGNYDPTCDRSWVELQCKVCGKFWEEDQDFYLKRWRIHKGYSN